MVITSRNAGVTHAPKSGTRNLHQNQIEHSYIWCKLLVPENFKHGRPIKSHSNILVTRIVESFWYQKLESVTSLLVPHIRMAKHT